MATGKEMAMQSALNLALKMFGVDSASMQQDIVAAANAVLTFGARLDKIEANQRAIMALLTEDISDAEIDTSRERIDGDKIQ